MKEGLDYRLELLKNEGIESGWSVHVPCNSPPKPAKKKGAQTRVLFPEDEPGDFSWRMVGWVSERREIHGTVWMYHVHSGDPGRRRWWGPCQSRLDAVTRCVHFHLHGTHDPGCYGVGDVRPAACVNCKKPIALGLTKNGRWVPVDQSLVTVMDSSGVFHQGRVSHYLTCPVAPHHLAETEDVKERETVEYDYD